VHQTPAEGCQHLVARRGAEGVVDVLEMVEIQGNHREAAPPAGLELMQLLQ
jgi:hypothetical protein